VTSEPNKALPGRRPIIPISLMVVGVLILGYGMILQAPVAPTALWSGVVDSSRTSGPAHGGAPGLGHPTTTVSLHLHKVPQVRTLRLPPSSASLSESLRSGDTVRVVVGWRMFETETASALNIWRNGTVVLDSAVVLGAQRSRRNRVALLGAVLALVGGVTLVRRGSKGH
jgi:hypothetical protein